MPKPGSRGLTAIERARIAQLLREMADILDAPEEPAKPTKRRRRQREPVKLDRKPTELQMARARKTLRNLGMG